MADVSGGLRVKTKSPAEFFADNKNISGFDNPGKCLYTTIRELLENGLDAAEAIGALPELSVAIQEHTASEFQALLGLESRTRVNEALYADYETEKAKKKRLAAEAKKAGKSIILDAEEDSLDGFSTLAGTSQAGASQTGASQSLEPLIGSQASAGGPSGTPAEKPAKRKRGERSFYTVTVHDNGIGMPHRDIPNMLGRVLTGTKYGVKQTRGKFGLGAKMALIWSKMSTGLPIEVETAQVGSETISYCKLDIDIHRNEPNVIVHEKRPNPDGWRGSKLSITIEGNWSTYKSKIEQYMRQMAVITPYAHFTLSFKGQRTSGKLVGFDFQRRSETMPAPAQEVKHHPASVDLLAVKALVAEVKSSMPLRTFLTTQFACLNRSLADSLIAELGDDWSPNMAVSKITPKQWHALVALFKEARFPPPSGNELSPVGEYNLRLGITKEFEPSFVATHQTQPRVFEGHSFIVEAGVSLGGKGEKYGVNVHRFANRIPLLFEAGSDVASVVARDIKWATYKVKPTTDKIGVFVSIVSTRVPFKGTGKEYIGSDILEIRAAVDAALKACARQLKTKLMKQISARAQQDRKKMLTKYVPDVARALNAVLDHIRQSGVAEGDNDLGGRSSKRQRTDVGAPPVTSLAISGETTFTNASLSSLWERVQSHGAVTEAMIAGKLTQHVEQADADAAMEAAQSSGKGGLAKVDFLLGTLPFAHEIPGADRVEAWMSSSAGLSLGLMPGVFQQPEN